MKEKNAKLRNVIRGEFQRSRLAAMQVISKARQLPPGTAFEAITIAYSLQGIAKLFALPRKCRHPRDLFSFPAFPELPLSGELEWASTLIACNADLLSRFCKECLTLRDAFFQGDSEGINRALERIAAVTGDSSWLLESKIALLQSAQGLEAQRRFIQEVQAATGPTLLGPITYFVGQRNEDLVSMQRFTSRVEQTLASWNFPHALDSYLRYKSIGLDTPSSEQLAQLLSVAATGSIIDLYETFVDIVIYVLTSRRVRELGLGNKLSALLTRASGRVDDYRLQNLARLAPTAGPAPLRLKALESETEDMTILRRLVLNARRGVRLEEATQPDSLEARLTRQVSTILMRDSDAEANAQDLMKFALNHPFLRENTFLLSTATEGRSASKFSVRSAAARPFR